MMSVSDIPRGDDIAPKQELWEIFAARMKDQAYDPAKIAQDILSVQPMDEAGKAFMEIYNTSKSETELKNGGYKPISSLGLMWVKDDTNDD